MFEFLIDVQRTIRAALSTDLVAFSRTGDWGALLAVLPLGIVFGVAHAMTPGHSKSVLAAYVLGSGLGFARALMTSFVLSITHITSAVVLALVANTLITRTIVGAGQAPALELTSRVLLVVIGIWLILRALRRRSHFHGEGLSVGFIAGLVPCPLTLFIMTYASSRGIPEAGLAFALAMLIGVGAVLSVVALGAVFARHALAEVFSRHQSALASVSQGVDLIAGVLLIAIAVQELMR